MNKPTASERPFGLLLCVVAAISAYYAYWKVNIFFALSLTLLTAVLVVMVFFCPSKFARLKLGWLWVGERLGAIVSPISLAVLYFVVLTPTGLVSRSLGRDPLRLRRRSCSTYWIPRPPPDRPLSEFYKQQF